MITQAGVKGRFALTVLRADGSVKEEVPFFDNLILDSFLEAVRVGITQSYFPNIAKTVRVGTGTLAPAVGQTTLAALTASIQGGQAGTSSYTETGIVVDGSTWTASATMTFMFALGSVVANISEVGFGLPGVTGSNVHSRALVTDTNGNPTAVTVTAQDQLIVKYQLILSGNDTDGSGTVSLGTPPVDYAWISRRPSGVQFPVGDYLNNNNAATSTAYAASNGALNGVGVSATGTAAAMTHAHQAGVLPGERRSSVSLATNEGNLSGGIKCIQWGNIGKFQFTPAVPKDANKVFSLVLSYRLTRS